MYSTHISYTSLTDEVSLLVILDTIGVLVKIFLMQVKQTVEKIMFYGGVFTLLIFQCYIGTTAIEKIKDKWIK